MFALVLTVQLFSGGPLVSWRVPSCERPFDEWLAAAHVWAENSGVPFSGAASCGADPDPPPPGFSRVELPERPGKFYWVPDSNTAHYRLPLPSNPH